VNKIAWHILRLCFV